MMFIHCIQLDNTMNLVYFILVSRLVNQVLLMYLPLQFLTQLKTLKLEPFRRQNLPTDHFSAIQDVFKPVLNKLQEAYLSLEQPLVLSSAIDEIRDKHNFLKYLKCIKLTDLIIHTSE